MLAMGVWETKAGPHYLLLCVLCLRHLFHLAEPPVQRAELWVLRLPLWVLPDLQQRQLPVRLQH